MSVKELCKGKTGHELKACKAFFDMSVSGEQALKNALEHDLKSLAAKKKKKKKNKAQTTLGINKTK